MNVQLLLHAPIVVLPRHDSKRPSNHDAKLKAWKNKRWSELSRSHSLLSNRMHSQSSALKLSPRVLALAATVSDAYGDDLDTPSPVENAVSKDDSGKLSPFFSDRKMSRITPARFRAIMDRASGNWDIEPVISMLKDDENMIPIKHIAFYQKGLERLPTLNDDEREFLKCISFTAREMTSHSSYVEDEDVKNEKITK